MLRNSLFDAEEIEKEKGVILEEMNVYLDTPQRYVGNVYDRLLYADQPLGWDILGTRETIAGATRDTFTSYLDAWYRPERIVVGIGGRLGEGLTDRLEELLGDIEGARPATRRPSSCRRTGRRCSSTRRSPSRRISSSACAATHSATRSAMRSSSCPSSWAAACHRLFTEVRERRGLSYYVHAANAAYTDAGTLYTGAGVDVNRIDEALDDHRRAAEDRRRARTGRRVREGPRLRRAGSCSGSRAHRP